MPWSELQLPEDELSAAVPALIETESNSESDGSGAGMQQECAFPYIFP